MIGGQVACRVRVAPVAGAHVAVLPDVPGDHSLGQACPSRVRVDTVIGTDAGESRVLGAAAGCSIGHDTTDRAELHQARRLPTHRSTRGAAVPRLTLVTLDCALFDITKSVAEADAGVYPSWVLHRGDQSWVGE